MMHCHLTNQFAIRAIAACIRDKTKMETDNDLPTARGTRVERLYLPAGTREQRARLIPPDHDSHASSNTKRAPLRSPSLLTNNYHRQA